MQIEAKLSIPKLNTTKLIPIIIITGEDKKQAKQQAMDAGAAGYLVKPIEFEILLTQINKTLGIKEDYNLDIPAPAETPEPEKATETTEPEKATEEPETPKASEKKPQKAKASSSWKDLIKKY